MAKLFYDHLVVREEIDIELDKFAIDAEEKAELIELIDQTLHHHVLNVIFNHLPKDKHPEFVKKLHGSPCDLELIDYLKIYAHPEIESKIRDQAAKIKKEIMGEIKKSTHKK
jgi:hypothetical protein